jgi:type IV secretory pathway TrbL component
MHGIPLIPILITIAVAIIIWWAAERFSPDPLITKIVQVVIFIAVLIKLLSLLGFA